LRDLLRRIRHKGGLFREAWRDEGPSGAARWSCTTVRNAIVYRVDLWTKWFPRGTHVAIPPTNDGARGSHVSIPPTFDGGRGSVSGREWVLLVSHEASRTGAPILALNVAEGLAERYNVFILTFRGGPLVGAFMDVGAAVMVSPEMYFDWAYAHAVISRLCEQHDFTFAVVNSIESRPVLPGLVDHSVPTICLVHEFSASSRPKGAFDDVFLWSTEPVFSTPATLSAARADNPEIRELPAHIIPQGRCQVPPDGVGELRLEREGARLRKRLRPDHCDPGTVLIIGAGAVIYRKGVDVFVELASRVLSTPEGALCRFAWIGSGYDPAMDGGFCAYLENAVRTAGLEDRVVFVPETDAIDVAYDEADILLLPSRLDPLPNVCIDAMEHGVPVLCFDKATGMADVLRENGLGDDCVAGFLDSGEMVAKILALATSAERRERVGSRSRAVARAYFDMARYVDAIDHLGGTAWERTRLERADTEAVLSSGLLVGEFACPEADLDLSEEAQARRYVRRWASGVKPRHPFPGFHPGIYRESAGQCAEGRDPFAEYLRAGQPDGTWRYPVITAHPGTTGELPAPGSVALHVHAFYPELLSELVARLSVNRARPDLFVTISEQTTEQPVTRAFRDYRGKVVDVRLVPNRGRDIGPLLTALGAELAHAYEFVGHVHTKKSTVYTDVSLAVAWYRFLIANLLGAPSIPMADTVLAAMNADPTLGLVFPDEPTAVGWGLNRPAAETLAAKLGIGDLPAAFMFPVGSMFWARTSALAPMLALGLDWDDYPDEPVPADGTILHAVERLFALSLPADCRTFAVTNVPGVLR